MSGCRRCGAVLKSCKATGRDGMNKEEKLLETLEEQRAIWAETGSAESQERDPKAGLEMESAAEGFGKCRNGEKTDK